MQSIGIFRRLHQSWRWRLVNGLLLVLSLSLVAPPAAVAQLVAQEAAARDAAARRARAFQVDLETGRLQLAVLDAVLLRSGDVTGVGRIWHAGAPAHGLGAGWRLSCDEQVTLPAGGNAVVWTPEGETVFVPGPNGAWISRDGVKSSLRRTADGFVWEKPALERRAYNAAGWLVRVDTPRGGFTVTRDAAGLATALTDAGGAKLDIRTNGGRYAAVRDPLGSEWTFTTDRDGRLTGVARPAGGREQYAYDDAGRLAAADTGFGRIEIAYDGAGRVTGQRFGGMELGRWTYETPNGGWVARGEQPLGVTTVLKRSADGRTREITGPDGVRREMTLDARGVVTRAEEDGKEVFQANADENGRYQEVRGGGDTLRLRYSPEGQLTLMGGLQGLEIEQKYDARGRLVSARGSDGGAAAWTWNDAGRCTTLVANGPGQAPQTITFTYDAAGRLLGMQRGTETVRFTPDALGRLTQIQAAGKTLTIAYDAECMPVSVTENGTVTFKAEYDARGLPVTMGGRGGTASFQYQLDGRVAAVTGAGGAAAQFAYDATGRLTAVQTPAGQYGFGYDAKGRLARGQGPAGGSVEVAYDAVGRPETVKYPAALLKMTRNAENGSVLKMDGGALGTVQFAYETGGGSLQGWKDSNGEELDRRDGTVTYRQTGVPCEVSSKVARGADGAIQTVRVNSEETMRRVFDANGRLVRIEGAAGVFKFTYDAQGRRSGLAYPNGVFAAYEYDAGGRLTRLALTGADGQVFQSWVHAYNDAGQRVRTTSADGRVKAFEYDAAGRLARVADGAGKTLEQFTWDKAGNLTATAGPGGTQAALTHDAQGRLQAAGAMLFTYDAQGRRVQRASPNAPALTYAYDGLSRLVKAGNDTFGYSVQGNRLWRGQAGGGRLHYLYAGADVAAETDKSGKVLATLVTSGVTPDEVLAVRGADGKWLFHHRDALQTLHAVTDSAGKPAAAFTYSAFGRPQTGEPATGHQRLYAGRDWIAGAGIYDNRARCFDPDTAQFLTPDPAGITGGLNPYLYADGNPLAYRDASGRVLPLLAVIAIGAAIGGATDALGQYLTMKPGDSFSWASFGLSVVFGGATGGLGTVYQGVKAAVIIAASSGFLKPILQKILEGKPIEWGNALLSSLLSGLTAGLFEKFLGPDASRWKDVWTGIKDKWGEAAQELIKSAVSGLIDTVVGAIKDKLGLGDVPGQIWDAITGVIGTLTTPIDYVGGTPNGMGPGDIWIVDWLGGGYGGGFFGGGGLPGTGSGGGKNRGPVTLDKFE